MRKSAAFFFIAVSALGLLACGNAKQSNTPVTEANTPKSEAEQAETSISTDNNNNTGVTSEMTTIQVIINGREFEAELNDNEAARQFTEMLPLQLNMEDLHDNEKYFLSAVAECDPDYRNPKKRKHSHYGSRGLWF